MSSCRVPLRNALWLMLGALLSAGVGATDMASLSAGGGITGTPHDFIAHGNGVDKRVCAQCHAPHDAGAQELSWSPKLVIPAFSLYSAPTAVIQKGDPGVNSRLCLSCHDGTMGILNYSGSRKNYLFAGGKLAGTAFSNRVAIRDHPIGSGYDTDLVRSDASMADPDARQVVLVSTKSPLNQTRTGNLAMMMLAEGRVECTSCHDVHNRYTVGATSKGLVKVGLNGSSLCQVCHEK